MGRLVLLASALAAWAALSPAHAADTTANGIDFVVDVNVVAVVHDRTQSAAADIRRSLRHLAIESKIAVAGGVATIRLNDPSRLAQACAIAEAITSDERDRRQHLGFAVATASDGTIKLTMTDAYKTEIIHDVVAQARTILAKRARAALGREISVAIVNSSNLAATATGKRDYGLLLSWLQPEPKLTFRMAVDVADGAPLPDGVEWLELSPSNSAKPARIAVEKRVLIDGTAIRSAGWSDIPDIGVVVTAQFNDEGEQLFADITKANIGKRLAVVMGDKVLTAPTIREPILGGSLQIDGDFTVKTANDLAVLIRAGSVPPPLTIVRCTLLGDDGAWKPCPIQP